MSKRRIQACRESFAVWKKTLKEPLSPSLQALSILLAKMIEQESEEDEQDNQTWKKHFTSQLADRKRLEELGL